MHLSIIIVNFNTKNTTAECIDSCLKEGSAVTKEVIVIDNGSSDGSVEYLNKRFGKEIILIENDSNLGFAKAVNQGIKISKGDYKYLLNSDTVVTRSTFKKLIDLAKDDNKIGIIGTKLILPDGSIQKSCFNFPTVGGAIKEFWLGKKENYSPFYKTVRSGVDAVVGASFFITPKAFEKVGLFDGRYFMFYEDFDYCKRVKKVGLKVVYVPEIIIFHHHGLSGKGIVKEKDQWRRLIPSSKIYHGIIRHNLINFILWSGQKARSIITVNSKQ